MLFAPSFVALTLAMSAAPGSAVAPADPLRFMPRQAGFVLKIDHPRHLAETVTGLAAFQGAKSLAAVREALEGTAVRRGLQFLAFVERETGSKWPELLDKAAGGGVAFGIIYSTEPYPALLIVQGTDEAASAKVFELLVRLIDEELARQGSPERITRSKRGEAEVAAVGKDLHLARVGTTLFASNRAEGLTAGLDLAMKTKSAESVLARPTLAEARKQLPKNPMAWFWLDFASIKETKQAKEFFENSRKDLAQTLLFGSTADCLRRSDYVAGGLFQDKTGFRFSVRLPAGRSGFPPEFAVHAPSLGQPGSLPLLEPPSVFYSQSFYLDPAALWKERDKLINPQVRKDFEKAEKEASKFIPGVKLGELLSLWGPYHRFVVVNNDKPPYKTEPSVKLPAFGYVTAMRDSQFGKSVEGLIRGAGFLGSLQLGLKTIEETVDGVKVVGYRFPEDAKFMGDANGLRFDFEPAFAIVGDQFILASTMELAKKLVVEVRKTAKKPGSAEVWQARAYAAATGDALAAAPDAAVSEAVLRQAIGLAEAQRQVGQLGAYLRTLGIVAITVDEAATEYRFDLTWQMEKAP